MDGEAVNACMVLAAEADGCRLVTIEGEAKDGRLSAIQEASTGTTRCSAASAPAA